MLIFHTLSITQRGFFVNTFGAFLSLFCPFFVLFPYNFYIILLLLYGRESAPRAKCRACTCAESAGALGGTYTLVFFALGHFNCRRFREMFL